MAKIKVSYAKIAAEKEAAEEVQEGGGSRLMAVRPALVHGLWMPPDPPPTTLLIDMASNEHFGKNNLEF